MILEKVNKLELTLPRVLVDIKLSPRVRHPLPSTSGFALGIVGSAGSGKTSTLISLIKSRDVYRKRFHNIITVIPESSIGSVFLVGRRDNLWKYFRTARKRRLAMVYAS